MKKVLTVLSVILITLFFINNKLNAYSEDLNIYIEEYHSIKFDNLNSKNINKLFNNIDGTVIEIEVSTSAFNKSYLLNTNMIFDIERNLMEKVLKDLEKLGKRELKTQYKTSGVKIIRIDIRCNKKSLELINQRYRSL